MCPAISLFARRHVLAWLLLLFLALSLIPQPVVASGMTGSDRGAPLVSGVPPRDTQAPIEPNTPAPGGPAAGITPSETSAEIDCADPPPGERARLVVDDEIGLTYRYRDDHKALRQKTLDRSGQNLAEIAGTDYSSTDGVSSVRWPAFTAADLDGDDRYELVSAFRDKHDRLGAVSDADYKNEWYADGDHYKGDDLKWVDIASGDLDRSGTDDEVVIAFEDAYNDIRVVLLDGNSAGGISQTANHTFGSWSDSSSSNGRGNVSYVAVATGDLNGDGFDDEIAVAFRDGNNDLQLLILRRNASGKMILLWSHAWTNHDRGDVARWEEGWENWRPIDVTTGDVDGDMRDDVIMGFRAGDESKGVAQLLVVSLVSEIADSTHPDGQFTMDDGVYVNHSLHVGKFHEAMAVSVAGADVDGDGIDEIALGYTTLDSDIAANGTHWQQHLYTYELVPVESDAWAGCQDDSGHFAACLAQRPGHWDGSHTKVPAFVHRDNIEAAVSIAAGDIDLDGKAEIVLARQDHDSGDVQVRSFDADSTLAQSSIATVSSGGNRIEEFWLTMGDTNGDSWFGTYTGQCYVQKEAQISSVIHAPPFWPEINEEETQAGYGQSVGEGTGKGTTAESMIGSSVTMGFAYKEAGPSFTYEWEKSTAVERKSLTTAVEGKRYVTHSPFYFEHDPYYGAIQFVEALYSCYDYTEPHVGTMKVCLPQPIDQAASLNYSLEYWYTDAVTEYASSWTPVGINLAEGRAASQSSTDDGGEAARAVDGMTGGNFYDKSVSLTRKEQNPWWEVDLGGLRAIDAIQVWNRTDCCGERLTNAYVMVSKEPFAPRTLETLLNDPRIWWAQIGGQAGRPGTLAVGAEGRYVRVQLAADDALNLAEVQVYGMPSVVSEWPTTRPLTVTASSFQLAWPDGVNQTVPGQVLYAWQGEQQKVTPGSGAAEFELELEKEGEYVEEGSTTQKVSLGMEIKTIGGEVTTGATQKTAYILAWHKATTFSGVAGGLPRVADAEYTYAFMPYVWLQRTVSSGGTNQGFLVLDYWVPYSTPVPPDDDPIVGITPMPPLVTSPTHPDPNTWVTTNTVTFDWSQPAIDSAVVDGYRWEIDQSPDTIPDSINLGYTTTVTYRNLDDGLWYFHTRAMGDGGDWSDPAHRGIRVDATAPELHLALDPPDPTGYNGWYITPVTVTITVSDGTGAGVAATEMSADGVTWMPYATPLVLNADTLGTTVYARAGDAAGNVSAPVSTTVKIDRTAPDSHVAGGQGPGAWQAALVLDPAGNDELVLSGQLLDGISGRSGMALEYDGLDWTSATWVKDAAQTTAGQAIEVDWYFTATSELGAGYHIFYGSASDNAGNVEEPYEIARVVWPPNASPELRGSSLTASPSVVRPGEVVDFTLVARNAGYQDAHVSITCTLPAGLSLITETLAADVQYNPATRVVTWPESLLWPGTHIRHTFSSRVAANVPASTLQTHADLHAFWPNTGLLTPEQRQAFLSREQTVSVTSSVAVDPALSPSRDVTPPWVSVTLAGQQRASGTDAPLALLAADDARWMYLREWTMHPVTGAWNSVRNSGWIAFSNSYTWTISAGQGVKYIGVWAADTAGNISTLDEGSLVFVNRIGGSQKLPDGQRIQYRGNLEYGNWVVASLLTVSGDPDMYIWKPINGYWPDLWSNDTVLPGQVENTGDLFVPKTGRFLLEVQAAGASEYALSFANPGADASSIASSAGVKPRPAHPLTVSDPISAGQAGTPGTRPATELFLPFVERGQ